jgi:hypothetical protein
LNILEVTEFVLDSVAKVNDRIVKQLNLSLLFKLDACGVQNAKVLEIELVIFREDVELSPLESLLGDDRVVIVLPFTNLKNALFTVNDYFNTI